MNANGCGAFGFEVLVWISSSFTPYIALETTELILTGWNLVLLVLHLILSAHAFQTFTDKRLPSLPRHFVGLDWSAIPLEHLSRTSLQKCVSRQDAQLSRYSAKAPFWTLTQISQEPTRKNITASTPSLPITKQGRWIALLIFSWRPSLQQSSNFSPVLNSLQFIQSFCSCRSLAFVFTT